MKTSAKVFVPQEVFKTYTHKKTKVVTESN